MTIHWKAVEQYFTVLLFVNPLTPRVKPWVIQSFLTFDYMDRTLKCDHSLESCQAVLWCCFFFNFTRLLVLENLSIKDFALSGVKGQKLTLHTLTTFLALSFLTVSSPKFANKQHHSKVLLDSFPMNSHTVEFCH